MLKLKDNQPSYTIRQITDLLGITRSEFKRQVFAGRFSNIDRLTGKLTGIVDDTVYEQADGTMTTIKEIILRKEGVSDNDDCI